LLVLNATQSMPGHLHQSVMLCGPITHMAVQMKELHYLQKIQVYNEKPFLASFFSSFVHKIRLIKIKIGESSHFFSNRSGECHSNSSKIFGFKQKMLVYY
jgi:hypothetical protein